MQPQTSYAHVGPDRVAYQVLGTGALDLVLAQSFGHVDAVWDNPRVALLVRSLASFSRLIRFDRRGTGASDPLPTLEGAAWESFSEELEAVMRATGSEKVAVIAGGPEVGPVVIAFAGNRPELCSALILADTTARYSFAEDYPIGVRRQDAQRMISRAQQEWGTEVQALLSAHVGDERYARDTARLQRSAASPRVVGEYFKALLEVDVRSCLPLIRVPTLVVHQTGQPYVPVEHGRYLAEHITGAKLVEVPGASPVPLVWDRPELALELFEPFLTGVQRAPLPSRVLATVMFTDIVGSTEQAGTLGDRRWRNLLEVHDERAQHLVEEAGGRLIETTGDGILATFPGPGQGIRCALAIRDELALIGLHIRVGLHAGEIELGENDIGGIAVHIAARVMAAAGPGEILVSRTVRDLIVGSDLALEDRGFHELRGVEGEWQLFAAV